MSIRLENISYHYEIKKTAAPSALHRINFEIHDGEFLGIIGKTGSGKSTLIQHFNGLLFPTEGRVLYNGEDIAKKGYPLSALRRSVGLVFQYPEYQLFENTVFEDVAFGLKKSGFNKEEVDRRVREALDKVEIDESFFERNPLELSGGQKRRVALAGILSMDPKVLVLDEPTVGLDPQGRDKVLDQIKQMHKEKNITIVLVSHDMEIVSKYTSRVIVLHHGSVVADDATRKIFADGEQLEKIGLDVPQVTHLIHKLQKRGFPIDTDILTVDEAKKAILASLLNNKTQSPLHAGESGVTQ